jgi:hypothetical protein
MMPNQLTLDDVLEMIMIEEEEPSYDTMNRWIARYPQYKVELVGFFGTWAIQSEETEESPPIDSEALASRGVSYALNLIDKREAAQSLLERARLAYLSVEQLAAQTRLDDSILQKLNQRLVTDVPQECVRRLASAVGETFEYVRRLISGTPVLAGVYKAKRKPAPVQELFLTAIRNSSLSEDDQDAWVSIVAAEKSDSARRQ